MNFTAPNFSSSKRGFPAGNPIANALVVIVGALVIGASIVLGFFAFVLLTSLFIVFSAIVGLRLWWFRRKMRARAAEADRQGSDGNPKVGVIEGEYHVVIEEREKPRPR